MGDWPRTQEWHSSTDRGQGTIGRSRANVGEFHDLLQKFVDINVAFWGARPGESTTRRCAEEWVQRANKVDHPGIPWSRIDGLREGLARGVEHMQNLCQSLHARHDMDTIARMRELLEESMEDDGKPLQFCMFLARLNAGLQTMRHDLEAVQDLSSQLTLEYVDELREVRLLFRQDLEGPETRRIPAYKGGARVPRHCI